MDARYQLLLNIPYMVTFAATIGIEPWQYSSFPPIGAIESAMSDCADLPVES
jgi:hypothetical protein